MSSTNSYGSMIFCRQCSNLLNLPGDADEIICDTCGALEDASATENQVITTRSAPNAFPSTLREKKVSLVQHQDIEKKKVMVDQPCPKCGAPQMSTFSLQLRSADEGATSFFVCEGRPNGKGGFTGGCGHRERLNN